MTIETAFSFHAGERAAQARAGVEPPRGAGIHRAMPDQHRHFFTQLPFVLLAAADETGQPIATALSGVPGFVSSPDPRHLVIAGALHAADPVGASLREGSLVGLLGIELPTRRRNRANGQLVGGGEGELVVEVEESFGNCAKYIQTRDMETDVPRVSRPPEPVSGLDPEARTLISAADTFFLATYASVRDDIPAGADISHRGGRPGFVRVEGNRLVIPDFSGNRYFNSFGNLILNPKAALLFVDFATGDLLELRGHARVDWDLPASAFAGAERFWHVDVERGLWRRGALGSRWRLREPAPSTLQTGAWPAPR